MRSAPETQQKAEEEQTLRQRRRRDAEKAEQSAQWKRSDRQRTATLVTAADVDPEGEEPLGQRRKLLSA